MPLIQEEKFRRKGDEKTADIVTVWLNKEERAVLESSKYILEQLKDGTAIKQLMIIGAKQLGTEQMTYILATIYSNKRKNKRLGIAEYE